MTLKTFISKLNWRQVIVHLLACYFLMYAFQTLSYLYDIRLVEISRHYDQSTLTQELDKRKIDHDYYADYLGYYPFMMGLIGLLVAFVISIVIAIKRRWLWLNSFIAFVITYFLYRLNIPPWKIVAPIFRYPGQIITGSVKLEFIINGIIPLAIGMLIFLSKYSKRFIERKYAAKYQ